MMSAGAIRQFQLDAAKRAAQQGLKPFVIYDDKEIDSFPPFPFPFIGEHKSKGWSKLRGQEDLFVDTSGFGSDGEAALSIGQLKAELRRLIAAHAGQTLGFALVAVGQFQGYLRVYVRRS